MIRLIFKPSYKIFAKVLQKFADLEETHNLFEHFDLKTSFYFKICKTLSFYFW